jgi:hypothetical protein
MEAARVTASIRLGVVSNRSCDFKNSLPLKSVGEFIKKYLLVVR